MNRRASQRRITSEARGRECTVRLPGICCHDPEQTVPAHLRMMGLSGAGYIADAIHFAFACTPCHDAIDRRTHMELDRDYVRLAHLEGVMRTQAILIREGLISV